HGRAAPTGRHVGTGGWPPADRVEVVDRERYARLPCDREQVKHGVGGAARGVDAGNGVLERTAGDDVARTHPATEEIHRAPARIDADVGFGRIGGGDARRSQGGGGEELEGQGPRVGRERAATRAHAGAGVVLEVLQVGIAELARGVRADRLEEVQHRDVAALEATRLDRAAVEDDAGDV